MSQAVPPGSDKEEPVYGRQLKAGRDEPILEPDLPIIDSHHHLFDRPAKPGMPPLRYLLDDYLADGALIAEWPENAGGFAHDPACLSIRFENAGKDAGMGRIAIVEPGADWVGRMPCP